MQQTGPMGLKNWMKGKTQKQILTVRVFSVEGVTGEVFLLVPL